MCTWIHLIIVTDPLLHHTMTMRTATFCLCLYLAAASAAQGDLSAQIEKAIQPIVERMASKYNCAVSVALVKDGTEGFEVITSPNLQQ